MIGGSAGAVALAVLATGAACIYCWKKRNQSNAPTVDVNPTYGYTEEDYESIQPGGRSPAVITDTNPYYWVGGDEEDEEDAGDNTAQDNTGKKSAGKDDTGEDNIGEVKTGEDNSGKDNGDQGSRSKASSGTKSAA